MSSPFTVSPFAQRQLIQVHRAKSTERDAYGNYPMLEAYEQVNGAFAPGPTSRASGGTTESASDRDQTTDQPIFYAAPGTAVSPIDAFIDGGTWIDENTTPTDGNWYEVDGQAAAWGSAFLAATPYGVEVPLRRVVG